MGRFKTIDIPLANIADILSGRTRLLHPLPLDAQCFGILPAYRSGDTFKFMVQSDEFPDNEGLDSEPLPNDLLHTNTRVPL